MTYTSDEYTASLCRAVEQVTGRHMQSPKDFEQLREHIYQRL